MSNLYDVLIKLLDVQSNEQDVREKFTALHAPYFPDVVGSSLGVSQSGTETDPSSGNDQLPAAY